ncbi:peptidoglycan editing factor PgeF [Parasphingorhabdus sp.]|uniref:peptidoglycan editing factor PgeF n=1 Tax=Parasphingorhabdus sp. TaxID=2709688 RepID=UPI003A92E338
MLPNRSTKALLDITTSPLLDGAKHGFLGRAGGVSKGVYAGLNVGLGSDDDREAIMENRRLAVEGLMPGGELVTVHQVHSADVVTVTGPLPLDQRPHADAMVTDQPNLLLGILTADCVPVLFHDSQAHVIGAAHAGWKGALAGVTDNVLTAMEALGSDRANIACAIGPCIAQASYEVDAAFRTRFIEADPDNDRFFVAGKPEHFQFDIEDYVAARLQKAGIAKIDKTDLDTYAGEDRYFSYRRSCHRNEPGYGRQISLLGLTE